MKKILLIMLFLIPLCMFAQTDRELLLEVVKQQAKLAEQQIETNKLVTELAKQQAITTTKVDSLEKSVEKRFDMQSNFTIAILAFIGVLTAGIFSFIGFILWDRKTANQPLADAFETKTDELKQENMELKKEIAIIKEKELKHLEKEMRVEFYLKQMSQIDSRFAPFNP